VIGPSGIVTFLFTDIEGSTLRWEADPDGMRAALAAHDKVLRTVVESRGGWLFKHTGDGICAVFHVPDAAIEAAVDAQRLLELPVRMGIATGEAEQQDDDYFGPALNRAARVMAAGHGGQVLVAESTASLVSGFDFVDLGARQLRDLSEPVRIFQVVADGLATEFPALRTLDRVLGNLRAQTTSFVGREAEVTELVEAMTAHRLVTLTGVGGVGKTRLAMQVAAQMVRAFPDGVWVVELAAVGDPAAVPDAVASIMGVMQQAGHSVAQSVASALEGRRCLLVFDNCEHVLDAAADLIDAILARSDTIKVLATSREGLRVPGEHLWPVPSLSVREGTESAGVELFLDRARSAVPGFSLTDEADAAAVVEICARLDGIPLAIELAAARMVAMSASEVRDRLDDRFRLLTGSRRGLERHQTLRHAVQWSYDLLDPDEKAVLDRCAVFSGGFDLEAAVAVAGGGLDEFAVLDLLDALVRKSLLTAERPSGRSRYGLLETIRQFAEDQIVGAGVGDEIRDRHAHYFGGLESDIFAQWASPNQGEVYEWLEREMANLRAAFRWAADRGDLDTAAAIAITAASVGQNADELQPVAWAEELIEPARVGDHRRLIGLLMTASLCAKTGRVEDGERYAEAARALLDDPRYDPPASEMAVWFGMSDVFMARPDLSVEAARAGMERIGDPLGTLRCTMVIGLVLMGRVDDAMEMAGSIVATAEATGVPVALAMALLAYGLAFRTADPPASMSALQRGVTVARDSGNRYYETISMAILAGLESDYGDPGHALDLYERTIRAYRDSGNYTHFSDTAGLAVLFDRMGRDEPAAILAGYATSPLAQQGVPELPAVRSRLRARLGDDRYDALTRRGATMAPAQALLYALNEIEGARGDMHHD